MNLRTWNPPTSIRIHIVRQPACKSLNYKPMKIGIFGTPPESVLGTVDRFAPCGLFSAIYKNRPPVQTTGGRFKGANQILGGRLGLVETCGTLILNFDYTRRSTLRRGRTS